MEEGNNMEEDLGSAWQNSEKLEPRIREAFLGTSGASAAVDEKCKTS